jgi:GTP cyclohydrolase I
MNAQERDVDIGRIQKAVTEILLAIGEDIEREGLKGTPERVAGMYAELLSGMREDPKKHLLLNF